MKAVKQVCAVMLVSIPLVFFGCGKTNQLPQVTSSEESAKDARLMADLILLQYSKQMSNWQSIQKEAKELSN